MLRQLQTSFEQCYSPIEYGQGCTTSPTGKYNELIKNEIYALVLN